MGGRRRGNRRGHPPRAAWLLEPALLLLLHQAPAHGYALVEELGRFRLGGLHPSVAYRTLRDMQEKGWISSTWDAQQAQGPPRRVYRLMPEGDEVLGAYIRDLQEMMGRIEDFVDAYRQHVQEQAGDCQR